MTVRTLGIDIGQTSFMQSARMHMVTSCCGSAAHACN
jgi:hypothetical protein